MNVGLMHVGSISSPTSLSMRRLVVRGAEQSTLYSTAARSSASRASAVSSSCAAGSFTLGSRRTSSVIMSTRRNGGVKSARNTGSVPGPFG